MVNGVPTGGLIQFVHQPSRQRDPLGPIAHHDGMRVTTGCHPCNVPDRTDNRSNLMQLLQGLSMAQKEDPCNIVAHWWPYPIGSPAKPPTRPARPYCASRWHAGHYRLSPM